MSLIVTSPILLSESGKQAQLEAVRIRYMPMERFILLRCELDDEKTIAPFRSKDVPLSPGLRSLSIVDDGAVYDISPQGQQALPPSPSLLTPLRPAESYMTEFVFDLPDRVRNPQLLITTAYRWPNRLLVGDEQSFLHQQTLLSLASD